MKLFKILGALLLVGLFSATAELHVNDSNTWRQAQGVYVNDSGTWRTIQEVYVNDSGTWRTVFLNAVVSVTDPTVQVVLGCPGCTSGIRYTASGTVEVFDGSAWGGLENYITPTSAATSFEILMHQIGISGVGCSTSGSGALDAWLALTSIRTWTISNDGGDGCQQDLTVSFRPAGGATVLTATVTLISAPGA